MKYIIKRIFDILGVLAGFIIFFVPIIFISFMVWIRMGRPLLFSQVRPGRDEKLFKMYKFRTMASTIDKQGCLLPDEQRLTTFGQFLRSTSLDELPALLNVLKGDMSLVGPRPLLIEYLPYYTEEQKQRHFVKPGLTGWAQVNGRNALSWEEKFSLDNWYVKNNNIFLDIKIIFFTIKNVIKKEGISHPGCVSMPRFDEESCNAHKE